MNRAFQLRQMNGDEAVRVSRWRYEEPYSFYNVDRYQEDVEDLLNPEFRDGRYFSAFDERGELAGFFEFKERGDEIEVGLGLRPDLTGKGLGLSFVLAGLDFVRQRSPSASLQLSVATFNERAVKVYERAGFRPAETFTQRNPDGNHEFLRMIL